jgi:upstream activation factor subunit UAF30
LRDTRVTLAFARRKDDHTQRSATTHSQENHDGGEEKGEGKEGLEAEDEGEEGSREKEVEAEAESGVHEANDAQRPASRSDWPQGAQLAAVIGPKARPRSQVAKSLWDYIKKYKLQDSKNRRMINADANLKAVFGGRGQVSMFEMTKLVSKHLS